MTLKFFDAMSMNDLGIGAKVRHDRYGDGIVSNLGLTTVTVFFRQHGEKEFTLDYDGFEVIAPVPRPSDVLSLEDVEAALAGVLQKFADFTPIIPLAERYKGGTIEIKPRDASLAGKEIPIDTFFHKIVMVRDRLRVLEQQINAHDKLDDQDKVQLQQYITRIYGSLTTFNILFREKDHHFKGESSKG